MNYIVKSLFLIIAAIMISVLVSCEAQPSGSIQDDSDGNTETVQAAAENLSGLDTIFGIEQIDHEMYQQIITPLDVTKDNLIEELYADGHAVPFSEYNSTFYLPASEDTSYSNTIITYKGSCELRFVHFSTDGFEGSAADSVRENHSYLLLANTDKECRVYHVVFTAFPVMSITEPGAASHSPEDESNPFDRNDTNVFMTLSDGSEYYESDAEIHIRGGSSASFPKTSYKLSLKKDGEQNKLDLLGMRKDDDWILVAMYTDESKIRDKMSYDLWQEIGASENSLGLDFGAKLEYIELVINNCYWGMYGLVVPVDGKTADIDEKNGEMLIKTESWEIPSSNEILHGHSADSVSSISVKAPDDMKKENWSEIADFVSLIYETHSDEFSKKITEHIEIENIVDNWILINTISGVDNGWKNMFMAFKHPKSGGYKVLLCPWDLDLTWGVTWDGFEPLFWKKEFIYLTEQFIGSGELPNLTIATVAEASDYLVKRWDELRASVLSEKALFDRVDTANANVRGCHAYDREVERWKSGGHTDDTENKYIKEFITARLAFLDGLVDMYR